MCSVIIISFRKVHNTSVLGYPEKKKTRGRGGEGEGRYGISRGIEEIASGFSGG